jgi:hypothetical protein
MGERRSVLGCRLKEPSHGCTASAVRYTGQAEVSFPISESDAAQPCSDLAAAQEEEDSRNSACFRGLATQRGEKREGRQMAQSAGVEELLQRLVSEVQPRLLR